MDAGADVGFPEWHDTCYMAGTGAEAVVALPFLYLPKVHMGLWVGFFHK